MKKNYYFLLFLLCTGLISFAQPTITASSFADYSTVGYSVTNLTGVSPASTGANQSWNYSSLVPDTSFGFYQKTIPYSSAPQNSSFDATNYCIKFYYTYATDLYESFIYVVKSNTGTETLGTINQKNGIITETIIYCDTPTSVLPLNFGDSYISTQKDTCTLPLITTTTTYDAYGSLITTYGTFNNVIRQKSIRSNSTSISYSFYQIIPSYQPIMSMTVNSLNVVTDVTLYQNTTGLGVDENRITNKTIIHPNPATNILNLEVPTNTKIDKIVITDVLGKIVVEETQNTSTINVENLSNGLYILQVYNNEQKTETKFVKQ